MIKDNKLELSASTLVFIRPLGVNWEVRVGEALLVALIGEEFQPVSKRIKLQELHYLESLPPTEKNSAQQSHVVYVPKQTNAEKCIISVQSVKRSQPFVWKIVLRSSTNNKIFYFLNLN